MSIKFTAPVIGIDISTPIQANIKQNGHKQTKNPWKTFKSKKVTTTLIRITSPQLAMYNQIITKKIS